MRWPSSPRGAPAPLGFEYGWVRGAGSAAFIVASIIAGWAIAQHGLSVVIWMQALLMLAVPFSVMRVPAVERQRRAGRHHALRASWSCSAFANSGSWFW